MNCADCGLENPPIQETCAFCETSLGVTPERRAEWEALGAPLREEFTRAFDRALQARRGWLEKLRRNRWRSALTGAIFNVLLLGVTHGPVTDGGGVAVFLFFLLDAAGGAGVGFALNFIRGGEYNGMALFGAWYAVSTFLKLVFGLMALGLAFGIFVLFGFVLALVLGYVFGLNLSLRRSLEL